jgi:hypothetical protein
MAAGFSGAEIVREVGWSSERMLFRYTKHLQAQLGAMARLVKRRARGAREQTEAGDR